MTTTRNDSVRIRRAPAWRRTLALTLASAAALAASTALSGCTPDQLGAAAVVNGEKISTAEVQDLTQEYLDAVPGQDPGQVQTAVVSQLIVERLLAQAATDHDVHVPRGRVASQVSQAVTQIGSRAKVSQLVLEQNSAIVPPSRLEQWLRDQYLIGLLGQKVSGNTGAPTPEDQDSARAELADYSRRLGVELNPRYGRWHPRQTITELPSGGLAKPAAELSSPDTP